MLDFTQFFSEAQKNPPAFDLLIVGGGAGGMSAAINGASERLKVCIVDSHTHLGGHARDSWAIENYPGFSRGITGKKLFDNMAAQTGKFGASMITNSTATKLNKLGSGGYVVTLKDGRQVKGTNVIISTGLDYTPMPVLEKKFLGKGVYYGMPKEVLSSAHLRAGAGNVAIIGGGNSAGQAAIHLATHKGVTVNLLVRSSVDKSMSGYLIDRLKDCKNINILTGVSVEKCDGDHELRSLTLSDGKKLPVNCVFVYAGSQPRTNWLKGAVDLDEKGFVKTWREVDAGLPYETSLPGVFAIGDVRAGSVKRIAGAVGEGGAALQMVHAYRAALPAAPPEEVTPVVQQRALPQKVVQRTPCRFPWDKAEDGSKCGKRATTYPRRAR